MALCDPWSGAGATALRQGSMGESTRPRIGHLAVLALAMGLVGPVSRLWDGGTETLVRLVPFVVFGALFVSAAVSSRVAVRLVAVPCVVAVGVLVTHQGFGATAFLVVILGVTVSLVVVAGWLPWSTRSRGPAALLAVPMIVAAEFVWRDSARLTLTLLLMVGALVISVGYRIAPQFFASVDRHVRTTVVAAVGVVGNVITFIVALPLLYLPGLCTHAVRRARQAFGGTWIARDIGVGAERRDFAQTFASAPSGVRRRRLAGGLALTLIATGSLVVLRRTQDPVAEAREVSPITGRELAGQSENAGDGAGDDAAIESPYSEVPAGVGLDWADEVQAEQSRVPLPPGSVAGYGLGEFESEYTNVKNGERVTLAAPKCECARLTVWFTGGSVAFGIGQRDEHTIPSELVRLAERDGISLDVRNIAVPGYTLWQEYQGILARLAASPERPDLVVFYDGFNDLIQTFVQLLVDGPKFDAPVVFDPSALESLRTAPPQDINATLAALGGADQLGKQQAERFNRLQGVVARHLGPEIPRTRFIFQPDATSSAEQRRTGMQAYSVIGPEMTDQFASFADAVVERLPSTTVNLRDMFDEVAEPVFFDIAHTNERGAAMVASRIYEGLRPELRSLAASSERRGG